MLAMVELNRHVKYAYNTDNVRIGAEVDGDGPGGEVDVEKGGSNIRIYRNHNDNNDRRRKNNRNRSKNGPGGVVLGPGGHGGGPGDLAAGGDRRGVGGQGRVRLDGRLSPHPHPHRDRDKTLYINEHISKDRDIKDNIRSDMADIDGVDQAPVAHGGGGVDLADGAARLEVGDRG